MNRLALFFGRLSKKSTLPNKIVIGSARYMDAVARAQNESYGMEFKQESDTLRHHRDHGWKR